MPRFGDKSGLATNAKKPSLVNGSNAGIGVSVLDQLLPAAEANQDSSKLISKNALADFNKLKMQKKNQEEFVSLTCSFSNYTNFRNKTCNVTRKIVGSRKRCKSKAI